MFLNSFIKVLPGRILSAVIDQISLGALLAILLIGGEVVSTPENMETTELYRAMILFSFLLNKDMFFGQSIGKHFVGLRVLHSRSGKAAGPIRCLVRNLFLLLWPIEVLFLLLSPKRRIGDIIAGTKVEPSTETQRERDQAYIQVILSIVISFAVGYYLLNFLDRFGMVR